MECRTEKKNSAFSTRREANDGDDGVNTGCSTTPIALPPVTHERTHTRNPKSRNVYTLNITTLLLRKGLGVYRRPGDIALLSLAPGSNIRYDTLDADEKERSEGP